MVHAIKMGWMKPRPAKKTEVEDESKRKFYMLWQTDDQVKRKDVRIFDPLLAGGGGNEKSPRPDSSPKDVPSWPRGELQPSSRVRNTRKRPTLIHCPSIRYLFTEKEKKEWERATAEGHNRKLPFIPQKFASLRQV